jgi:ATP synthase protein I
VQNHPSSAQRLAAWVVLSQVAASALSSLGWLAAGPREALAALAGGAVATVATALFALRYLGGSGVTAGTVLARLFAGTLLKWLVMIGGLYVLLGRLAWPALPVVTGFGAALVAQVAGGFIKAMTERSA